VRRSASKLVGQEHQAIAARAARVEVYEHGVGALGAGRGGLEDSHPDAVERVVEDLTARAV